jgi:hypothetical protein
LPRKKQKFNAVWVDSQVFGQFLHSNFTNRFLILYPKEAKKKRDRVEQTAREEKEEREKKKGTKYRNGGKKKKNSRDSSLPDLYFANNSSIRLASTVFPGEYETLRGFWKKSSTLTSKFQPC